MRVHELAKELGFGEAAILPVNDLVVVEEYRKYCEENICGNFNKLKAFIKPVSSKL